MSGVLKHWFLNDADETCTVQQLRTFSTMNRP